MADPILDDTSEIPSVPVIDEVNNEPKVGIWTGQTKWFADRLGYGFITVQMGQYKGKDIFVHHSGIHPLNSNYKTLKKGEYVNFDVIIGDNGLMQAVNVTGIGGGSLICDVNPHIKPMLSISRPPLNASPGAPREYRSRRSTGSNNTGGEGDFQVVRGRGPRHVAERQ